MKCACVQSYMSTERVERKIGPDELMRCAKPITVATAKAVAAGNSGRQEDVIAAANVGRKAVFDLLRACKVSLEQPPCEYLESQKLLLSCFCQQPFTVKKVHLDFFIIHANDDPFLWENPSVFWSQDLQHDPVHVAGMCCLSALWFFFVPKSVHFSKVKNIWRRQRSFNGHFPGQPG